MSRSTKRAYDYETKTFVESTPYEKKQRFLGNWLSGVPKWFKRHLNKKIKTKNTAILERTLSDDPDEIVFAPYKKTANWEWW